MSNFNELEKKIARIEASIGASQKFNIPIQEYVRPEIISFYGSVSSGGVIVQPEQFFTVNPDRYLFIKYINTLVSSSTTTPATDNDHYVIKFNLKDSGRNYNFFNSEVSVGLFSQVYPKNTNDGFIGILCKQNSVIQCSLYKSDNPSVNVNVGIFLVGDLIDPVYLQYYFYKGFWRK